MHSDNEKRIWRIKQSDAFNLDQDKVKEFDKRFKQKEKKYQYSQELFKMNIRAYLKQDS